MDTQNDPKTFPTPSSPGFPQDATPFHALIIEDDEVTARILQLTLDRRCGALVRVVGSAEEAMALLRMPIRWDVVFVDIGLPRASGLDLVMVSSRMRPDVPHIVVTGHDTDLDAQAARLAGACDFLAKPVATDALLTSVMRVLPHVQVAA